MYNTRRSAYLNSCSTAMELPPQSMHQNWQDTEYVNTSCNNEIDCSDMPVFEGKDDQRFYDEEQNNGNGSGSGSGGGGGKKGGRKRANTTSSNGGDKESKRTANKVCRVCGDKAFSYNFNVITCESCKAFFRRNANKEKEIRCPFNEQCDINQVSRRFCQRCRLTKCFSVGMKKEWIMSEEARLEKKQRVEENRERRMMDAMKCAIDEANMEEDSENSFDEAPKSSQISVRQYLANGENSVQHQNMNNGHVGHQSRQMDQYNEMKDNNKMLNYYQDEPSDMGYSNQNYDYPISSCASSCPEPMDQTDYCGATTIADSGASPSNKVAVIAPAHTAVETKPPSLPIEQNPLPPSVLFSASMSAIQDVAAIMSSEPNNLGMCPPDVVSDNLINAAQVAVQAQAIVNHTQQLAAAVVAQQVVSHIGPVIPNVAPIDPLIAPALMPAPPSIAPMTTAIADPIAAAIVAPMVPIAPPLAVGPLGVPLAPPMNPAPQSLGIPIIPKEIPVNDKLLNELEKTNAQMVTVHKDVLMKLLQNNSRTSCTCTCQCGRYPPGSCIVDEVTKDLINSGGSSNSSNAADKDETRLDTTEDMQMNGLLPGESNSSIQWLSQQSSAQAVVDPISVSMSAEEVETQRERRDSIFGAYSTAEQTTATQPKSVQEETFWEHTVAENESRELSEEEVEKMEELNEISNKWMGSGMDNIPLLELFTDENIKAIIDALKLSSAFRFLPKGDKRSIVKRGIFNYCVVKWMQHKESMSLDGLSDEVKKDFNALIKRQEYTYRVQPGAFNTLAMSALLYNTSDVVISKEVYMEHVFFKNLLDKNLPIKVSSDAIYNNYLPCIIKAGNHLKKITGGITDRLLRNAIS
ncbi:CBN-NHR-48 protein [Caenorhabditis brenneri]|uniref:CBN-NHR-48 protein n=1 Tax=Caenorhabditis brenneri TaxID=135651 RepID=G0MAS2_CAEBE|nr:CBN-NHR-48 protein [Caenorhabditis brenneri]